MPDSVVILREPIITMLARPHFTEPSHLRVQWVGEATDGERLAEYAGRLATMSQDNPARRTTREYLESARNSDHDHVLEHAVYSILVEGVSRSLTHDLVGHHSEFTCSERSPRFEGEDGARFVMPAAISGDETLVDAWTAQVISARTTYCALVEALMSRYGWVADKTQRRKMARDAASSVLPCSTETKIIVTGSAQAWRTLVITRARENSEAEMRRLAIAVLRTMQAAAPAFFDDFIVYCASDRLEAARCAP